MARIERVAPRTISVIGPFFVKGCYVYATEEGLWIAQNRVLLDRSRITGFGTAVKVDHRSTTIGFSGSPPRR